MGSEGYEGASPCKPFPWTLFVFQRLCLLRGALAGSLTCMVDILPFLVCPPCGHLWQGRLLASVLVLAVT
jgi:hypothetical protein